MQQIVKKNVKHIQLHCKFDLVVVSYYHLIIILLSSYHI
nr:MAG TPA: hypothetical protein [Caudoviricetes sp.]